MHNLITFLIKNVSWFLFILLEIISFLFVFNSNSYQRSVFFNTSNELAGRIYAVSGEVSSFFGLRQSNEELLLQNAALQQQVFELESYIESLHSDSLKTVAFLPDSGRESEYAYIVAHVVNNSVSRIENYIMINKGKNDGIKPEMGVVSKDGIVGFVRTVSPNYALVQSVLNPKTQLNCKIKSSNVSTTLVWDGEDPRYADLKDFPRYEHFEQGDTAITSGVSKFFPEGFIVGTIEDYKSQKDDNFLTLRVKLAADFSTLNNVLVINNYRRRELIELKEEVGIE
ncbi:rod shape-determining protein MreC [Viscerimonas tarda]